jgi:hypothetical protein
MWVLACLKTDICGSYGFLRLIWAIKTTEAKENGLFKVYERILEKSQEKHARTLA